MTLTEIMYLIAFGIAMAFETFYYRRAKRQKIELIEANLTIEQLQKEKTELVGEIALILQEEWTVKKAETVNKWKLKFETEKMMWQGSRKNIGNGIISQIQNKQK